MVDIWRAQCARLSNVHFFHSLKGFGAGMMGLIKPGKTHIKRKHLATPHNLTATCLFLVESTFPCDVRCGASLGLVRTHRICLWEVEKAAKGVHHLSGQPRRSFCSARMLGLLGFCGECKTMSIGYESISFTSLSVQMHTNTLVFGDLYFGPLIITNHPPIMVFHKKRAHVYSIYIYIYRVPAIWVSTFSTNADDAF